jgi:methylase of polypeptide subunit release factors
MPEFHNSFVSRSFLRSVWGAEYESFKGSPEEARLVEILRLWSERKDLKETSAEAAFLQTFFVELWGYTQAGQQEKKLGFTLHPKYAVKGAGEKGGTGEADLAIGWFDNPNLPDAPQILCEFKDIRSALDAPQKRKGNTRPPVKQCLDYLSASRREFFGNEAVLPSWGVVTDMNEFRLYWYDRGPQQYLSFVIRPLELFQGPGLLAETEEARFDRFAFSKLFHRDTLLTIGGKPLLMRLIAQQWVRQRELENEFYGEYRRFRERLYRALLLFNPVFPHTKGRLVRLAQKILDRCIFIFYCEDMGRALGFPPQLLRDLLIQESRDNYFNPKGKTIWLKLLDLFRAMNDGTAFGEYKLNQFNGGLFAPDLDLESLIVPNEIFCQPKQGENEASLYAHRETLLFLSAYYNYASGWEDALTRTPSHDAPQRHLKSLGLYTLGRIFEQSITELEILEAEAENRPSLNKLAKRKRDGVYYTPEWVVERIVEETLGARIAELKRECGWPENDLPPKQVIEEFQKRLKTITIVDPACGSGAFLIAALRHLLREWHALQAIRRDAHKDPFARDDDALVRDILRANIYGVDINPAAVEIAQLALWLHTARSDKPLSSLVHTIRDGNSLIDGDFYKGLDNLALYDADQKERVHTFDWEEQFAETGGKFDVVVGNPPYVKLQNFRRVHSDMAEFIRDGRPALHISGYASAQTGNFDLYLPFIEKGLQLLNENGRLGYIAPSLWAVNEYGEGLRNLIQKTHQLERWLDFKSFQVFEEATTYTALQFFTKRPNKAVMVAFSPDGPPPERPWADPDCALPYDEIQFGDRWLLLTGKERVLIDKLYARCTRLDDPENTSNIFVGIQTSADSIYHLKRLTPGRYLCTPKGDGAPPPYEVELEDDLMKPLVSGADAKRYVEPISQTFLLFPYVVRADGTRLIAEKYFQQRYPKAWKYLVSYEEVLRRREAELLPSGEFKRDAAGALLKAPFNDDEWYRFGRHQNLDKQEIEKLIVPRLVTTVFCSVDRIGEAYLDNVDVGGIAPVAGTDLFFLAGVMNGPVAGYVFRRISKPFRGDYRSANKQFIAPLPIPPATQEEMADIAGRAKSLQIFHTKRRDLLDSIARRLSAAPVKRRPDNFLFPDLAPAKARLEQAPKTFDAAERREWAKGRYEEALQARYDTVGERLRPGAPLNATFTKGELKFLVDALPVIDKIFLSDADGPFLAAQWKVVASTFAIPEHKAGERLCNELRKLIDTDNAALRNQIMALQAELAETEGSIAAMEAEINGVLDRLYGLTEKEMALVRAG